MLKKPGNAFGGENNWTIRGMLQTSKDSARYQGALRKSDLEEPKVLGRKKGNWSSPEMRERG